VEQQTLRVNLPRKFSVPGLPELNHSQLQAIKSVLQKPLSLIQVGDTLVALCLRSVDRRNGAGVSLKLMEAAGFTYSCQFCRALLERARR
jgi:hypothetical protein